MRVQVSCVLGDEEAVKDNLWEIAKRDRGILCRLCEYKCVDVIEGKACVDGRKYACSAVTKRDTVLWGQASKGLLRCEAQVFRYRFVTWYGNSGLYRIVTSNVESERVSATGKL